MIEIGAYKGESTTVFCKHFKKVIVIDAWQTGYDDTSKASVAKSAAPLATFKSTSASGDPTGVRPEHRAQSVRPYPVFVIGFYMFNMFLYV